MPVPLKSIFDDAEAIVTADGKTFMTESSAENAGYIQAWVKESEVVA